MHMEQLQLSTVYSGRGGDSVSERLMKPQWHPASYVPDSFSVSAVLMLAVCSYGGFLGEKGFGCRWSCSGTLH